MRTVIPLIGLVAILTGLRSMAQDEAAASGGGAAAAGQTQAVPEKGPVADEVGAFQASLTPNVALQSRSTTIEGLSLNIWGENPQKGLAIGIVNGSTGKSRGASVGVYNYAESLVGFQWGFANSADEDCAGWQGGFCVGVLLSVFNYAGGNMTGLQSGLVNYAGVLSGVQVGIVNYARTAEGGVQIGLVNVIPQNTGCFTQWPNEVAPGMVLVNWHF